MSPYWLCLPRSCIRHVAPWMVAAYAAVAPVPVCEQRCTWAIPPAAWAPGGMFYGMGNGYGMGAGYALAPAGAYPLGSYASGGGGGGGGGGAGYAPAPAATPVADTALLLAPQPASVAVVAPYVSLGVVSLASPVQVPEPAAWTVFAVAAVGLVAVRGRRVRRV